MGWGVVGLRSSVQEQCLVWVSFGSGWVMYGVLGGLE